jgi:hypothetical protein
MTDTFVGNKVTKLPLNFLILGIAGGVCFAVPWYSSVRLFSSSYMSHVRGPPVIA